MSAWMRVFTLVPSYNVTKIPVKDIVYRHNRRDLVGEVTIFQKFFVKYNRQDTQKSTQSREVSSLNYHKATLE